MNFKALHEKGNCLVLGGAWNPLSAMIMEQKGFKAVGTTSWGVANEFGYQDGEKISFDDYVFLVKKMLAVISIPLSVDIETGFSNNDSGVAENVLRLAELGVAGINIEDSSKDNTALVSVDAFSARLEKIRTTLDTKGFTDFFVNARIDTYLQLENPLAETISRAQSFEKHGANGIFVPFMTDDADIKALISEIKVPLNILSLPNFSDVEHAKKIGVRRLSFGNAMSDAIISDIEGYSDKILSNNNTSSLYDHGKLSTNFK
jgi:2-methylisocitrate lyase-like PEP mutase family enzyme